MLGVVVVVDSIETSLFSDVCDDDRDHILPIKLLFFGLDFAEDLEKLMLSELL